ncbi:hypothetical protein PSTG_13490 [Puccinia striiformis f. sp. tritici PST-78]|uniref:Tet-like 2OG-Fe(II) oxygenase domain-containing protein n=1 Tax=Puccinia striiformis f. sp. tritici PST-78 TaxID=1165861 RepID=A0A0L0V1N7_9BASI|nr:hypothetical protein PSTG_13490 [Puccinia striiformis f. sp. tritici PST-78]
MKAPQKKKRVDLLFSFEIIIPTFKPSGKIGLESEGHRIDNGHLMFPDVQISIIMKGEIEPLRHELNDAGSP